MTRIETILLDRDGTLIEERHYLREPDLVALVPGAAAPMRRLAGLWPHQQLEVVQAAGAHIFGPAVTTDTGRSSPWNVARACTFVKACSQIAEIPVHANVGMGVGGVPTVEVQPNDIVTRAGVALVEVGGADGL